MTSANADTLAAELLQRAEEKLGKERAEALRPDLRQMANELAALQACELEFDDEP